MKRVESKNLALPEGSSLADFMATLCLHYGEEVRHPAVLVALNGQAAREPEWQRIALENGDVISVVQAFAGG